MEAYDTKYALAARPLIMLEELPRVIEAWPVTVKGIARFEVPKDTTTDGASIPRFLWRLCGHPLEVPRVYAALAHDWLYSGGIADMSRKEADKCYYKLERHFRIGWFRARVEYYALRIFGGSHWSE